MRSGAPNVKLDASNPKPHKAVAKFLLEFAEQWEGGGSPYWPGQSARLCAVEAGGLKGVKQRKGPLHE
ncbi:hypothetical protein SEA_HOKKEND_77 [Mycobacterium phage HokkenD]|nr:hypothetical protein SEA_ZELINK_85 [Mycobacterium phage Zelink]QBI97533.1 hypothetical protein SEA_HUGHESYANG_88 [Mycobacterium phage Hughesyang]QDM55663.1 hypothetical protein SEA_HOKKEND_77 [Mycobacterium phage HokkenD]UEM46572.1 hypothetical protein SEA_JUICYJAY_85 [Mycobacterium phage JuicyJay]